MILGELGINLGPLIAGAGIVGVAVGFGAQSVVKDFLSGMFMLVEDQYGVGDSIDVGLVSGTVERVTLRTTILRDGMEASGIYQMERSLVWKPVPGMGSSLVGH